MAVRYRITSLMLKCSFGLDAYLTVNTMSLNLYTSSADSSISTRTSQRTQCFSTYILDQLFLRSQRVPHSEHSLSQPILMLSCFFHLNAYLTANTVSLNLYSSSAASSVSTRTSQRTQCLSTYTFDQLLLRSQHVPHSEHSLSQPILTLSCFFHLNAHLTAHIVFLQPVLTLNCFFGLNAYLTANTISTYSATMATRMASLLGMAIGVTHPLTQAPTQSLTQENYDYMAGVSACSSLCCCILWT